MRKPLCRKLISNSDVWVNLVSLLTDFSQNHLCLKSLGIFKCCSDKRWYTYADLGGPRGSQDPTRYSLKGRIIKGKAANRVCCQTPRPAFVLVHPCHRAYACLAIGWVQWINSRITYTWFSTLWNYYWEAPRQPGEMLGLSPCLNFHFQSSTEFNRMEIAALVFPGVLENKQSKQLRA